MSKAAIVKLIVFIVKEAAEYAVEIANLLMSDKKIEDSELYRRLPRTRKIEMLRQKRALDR